MACKRIAMWTGPRNISTTMMRSFENRPDCAVIDEPLYAAYLTQASLTHPMQAEILAAQKHDWREVVTDLTSQAPAPIWFQKHMCHHITADMSLDWLANLSHFFLIRDPALMIASYSEKMESLSAEALGLQQEAALFDHISKLQGHPPPVVDANQVLENPKAVLTALCNRLEIPFMEEMLSWPAGPRDSDGVWAPHWYNAVTTSTGFRPPVAKEVTLDEKARTVLAETTLYYEHLKKHLLPI
jgi:hypothetical protein